MSDGAVSSHTQPFIQALMDTVQPLLDDAIKTDDEGHGFTLTRELRSHEEYARAAFMAAFEILRVLVQLQETVTFLRCPECSRSVEGLGIARHQYVRYHIEGHALRVTGVFDRALVLVNHVLQLGNPPENCLRHVIMKNTKLRDTDVVAPLSTLQSFVDKTRDERDLIAHRGHYSHGGLLLLESLEYAPEGEVAQRVAPWQVLAQRMYISEEIERLNEINSKVSSLVNEVFDGLLSGFNEAYEAMAAP